MRLPFRRAPQPPERPFVPVDGWAAELIDASDDADAAADMLAEALFRRRRAASALAGETRGSKAALSVLMSPYATGRALWAHGFANRTLGELVAAPHIVAAARSSFEHQARAAIMLTRGGRPAGTPSEPAPAESGIGEPVE